MGVKLGKSQYLLTSFFTYIKYNKIYTIYIIIKKYLKTYPLQKKLCNSLKKENFPMRGACLTENVLYYTRVSCDDETYKPKLYKETTFKKCYANHKKSFIAEKNKNDNNLSTEHWKLANKKLHLQISWSIKGNYKSYKPSSRRWSLCLHEKLKIVDDPGEILINKCSKVISLCHHQNLYKLDS